MAASPKIVLSRSQGIPFNKPVLSQANVRRVKAGVSVEALAESIVRHSLLQSLTVRPVLDADGQETGMFEVPVGGRRFRALEWLVAQKRMNKIAPVPCIIRTDGIAEGTGRPADGRCSTLCHCARVHLPDDGHLPLSPRRLEHLPSAGRPVGGHRPT